MSLDVQRLREALSGGNGGVAALLAEHPDPTVRLISEIWSREREEPVPDPEPEPTPGQETIDLVAELQDAARRERVLNRRLARANADLERLARFTDALAAALGACVRCWGDDPCCHDCAGAGKPGAMQPNLPLFARYVAPAARRMITARITERTRDVSPEPPIDDRATTTERRDP